MYEASKSQPLAPDISFPAASATQSLISVRLCRYKITSLTASSNTQLRVPRAVPSPMYCSEAGDNDHIQYDKLSTSSRHSLSLHATVHLETLRLHLPAVFKLRLQLQFSHHTKSHQCVSCERTVPRRKSRRSNITVLSFVRLSVCLSVSLCVCVCSVCQTLPELSSVSVCRRRKPSFKELTDTSTNSQHPTTQ